MNRLTRDSPADMQAGKKPGMREKNRLFVKMNSVQEGKQETDSTDGATHLNCPSPKGQRNAVSIKLVFSPARLKSQELKRWII